MRYLIQFAIPALIFVGVVYAASKFNDRRKGENGDGRGMFLLILVVGAAVAVAALFVLQNLWAV